MDVTYAAETTLEPLYIYRVPTREGSSFQLAPLMKERLQDLFGVHPRRSLFIDHSTKDEMNRFYADLAGQVIQLLTGVTRERLEEKFGKVVFLDADTDKEIQPEQRK